MAALRRATNPRQKAGSWPVIAFLGGDIGRLEYTIIAGLYATHPEESTSKNFGATCRQIALKDSGNSELPESSERRFRRLIACDSADELGDHLRTWIRLASSKSVGVNYERLFADLCNWSGFADKIRVQWATQFWPARSIQEQPANTGEPTA
jgi:CRISPR type I-E-associated protein CasB/Cse2